MNDTDSRIGYSGSGWKSSQSRGDSLPDFARGIHYTSNNGDSYSYSFSGTSVTLLAEKTPTHGTSTVSIDGGSAVTVNQYSATNLFQQNIFSRTGLSAGGHIIKVTKTGGTYTDIDAIVVR